MALKRETLKAMGLTDEQVTSIIEMHTETVNGLKSLADQRKADADKLPDVQRQLDEANAKLAEGNKDSWKVKYDAIKEEFDTYKADAAAKKTKADKENAYRDILKGIGVADKLLDKVLKVTDLSAAELDENGKFKDADKLAEAAKTEWADFVSAGGAPKVDTGANLNKGGAAMTKNDIMAIKDRGERRAAIAANMNLFKGE